MAGRARASKVSLLARLRTYAPGHKRVQMKGGYTAAHRGQAVPGAAADYAARALGGATRLIAARQSPFNRPRGTSRRWGRLRHGAGKQRLKNLSSLVVYWARLAWRHPDDGRLAASVECAVMAYRDEMTMRR